MKPDSDAGSMEEIEAVRFYGARDARWEKIPRFRSIEGNQVRIRVSAGGICGSDLHVYQTGSYITRIPVTMGHEFSGVVVEVGREVANLRPSDQVVGDSRVVCGTCPYCLAGKQNLCLNLGFLGEVRDGAFCEEIVLDSQSVAKVSSEVPFDLAVLVEPIAVSLHALRQAELRSASRILVLGGGPIGALLFTILGLRSHDSVTIVEPSEYRRAILSRIGPQRVFGSAAGEFDLVFDSSGSEQAIARLLDENLAKQAQVVVVGLYRQPSCINLTRVVENEWRIAGSSVFTDELPEAVGLVEEHWRELAPIVTHRFSLKDIGEALRLVLSPQKEAMKVLLLP